MPRILAIFKRDYLAYFRTPMGYVVFAIFMGHEANGSQRWINLGFFKLQPSEPAKMIMVITLASYYARKEVVEHKVMVRHVPTKRDGAINAIAGIVNENGNVLGMMPHPERATEAALGSADGKGLFASLMGGMALA